ncbi:MAG: 50S ribosomal protein L25 [Patescibacteria group bacterium]|nr:50S ribosomal protein L25 [Patescibacteria group bacterium]
MIELKAKIREKFGRKTKTLRKQGIIPAILYGAGIKNLSLEVAEKEFREVFKEAGESSLVKLKIQNPKSKINEPEVLIHDIAKDPLTERILHIDFYHPSLKKEIEAEIPLSFEGISTAEKELGGTLVREIQQVKVKGLVQNLPREIKVDIGVLRTFEDRILVKDLTVSPGVTILKDKEDIVAHIVPPTEEEEIEKKEKEKPTEEKLEEEKPEEEEKKKKLHET